MHSDNAIATNFLTRSIRSHSDGKILVFSGLMIALFMAALDATIVSTALATIVSDLGGLDHISWLVTAYLLAQTIVTPLYGKLGDLYGRKVVMQAAIVLFLIGSALCGLSRSLTELICFRALQGLGGGGLVVTTQAIVGDIVAPRDRGRYQGIFGAVFALSSVAGPLIGGYLTSYVSWRWIFYINVPVGAVALLIVGFALSATAHRERRKIDYVGAGLLAVLLSTLVIGCDVAPAVGWQSPTMLALLAIVLAALILFVIVERRAIEPVLPLRLFRNRIFLVTSGIAFVVGAALFGAVTYMPLFLQVIKGSSPTAAGLEMTPMMGGVVLTSIAAGQIISRLGRYRFFPIAGTAIMTLALFLFSGLTPESTTLQASLRMLLLGLGMGMVMQVLVIAVQNAVEYRDLGVATSAAMLFRLVGGAVGTAVLGGIFSSLLENHLAAVPLTAAHALDAKSINSTVLANLSPALHEAYAHAFTGALTETFLIAAGLALVGFLLSWVLPELPLRQSVAASTADNAGSNAGQAFPMPSDPDSLSLLLRGIVNLADRDVQRRYVGSIVARSGVDLSPLAAWLLVRIEENSHVDLEYLSRRYKIEMERMKTAFDQLAGRGLLILERENGAPRYRITSEGCVLYNRLVKARRDHLAEISSDWTEKEREKISRLVNELSRQLIPETHAKPQR